MSDHSKLFRELMGNLERESIYQKALDEAIDKYTIRPFNIDKLSPEKVTELYDLIEKKFYGSVQEAMESSWFQNQLRIYVWLLVGFCYLNQKEIKQLGPEDWSYFSRIFNNRNPDIFQFQGKCLMKNENKLIKWAPQEVQLLMSLIDQKDTKKKWNEVAKELFIRSKKLYFRTGKQCRERWLNHLDPNKVRSAWTKEEDELLINYVLEHGKRWSHIVKALGNTRTQHMVKNRFKSLFNFQARRNPQKNEDQVVNAMAYKLENNISIKESKGKNKPRRQIVSNRPDYIPGIIQKKIIRIEALSNCKTNHIGKIELQNTVAAKNEQIKTDTLLVDREPIVEQEGSKSPSIFWNFPEKNSHCYNCTSNNNILGNDKWQLQLNFDYGINRYLPNIGFQEQQEFHK